MPMPETSTTAHQARYARGAQAFIRHRPMQLAAAVAPYARRTIVNMGPPKGIRDAVPELGI